MKLRTLKQGESYTIGKCRFTVDYNMRDYSDEPYFQKKLAQAKASIAKCPLPHMRKHLNPPPSEVQA